MVPKQRRVTHGIATHGALSQLLHPCRHCHGIATHGALSSCLSRVGIAGRGSAWRVGDTQHPYPTLSELVRWTADQVGKTSSSAAEQAPGVSVAAPHQQSLGSWPTEGSKERSAAHCRA